MTKSVSRREFLRTSGLRIGSGLSFAFIVNGQTEWLTPAQAKTRNASFQKLNSAQADTLETLAEAIVPGARKAGIAHYIDAQLAANPEDALLMIRYLGVPAPYQGFYTSSLDSAKALLSKTVDRDLDAFIDKLAEGSLEDWAGPPANFFYFVLRADAADVVYGTQDGFKKLGIPYVAHIAPTQDW